MTVNKISVIVPVYNVKQYLVDCLNSIREQTYGNIEVILVDDGSRDGSSAICDEFVAMDHRFSVIHKDNGGLSSARNVGLKYVTGEYVAFIDSDDWIEPRHFEKLSIGMTSRADIINGDYTIYYKRKKYPKKDKLNEGLYIGENIVKDYLLPLIQNGTHMPVWTNLYSFDFLQRINLKFISEREIYAEDELFNIIAFASCQSIYKVESPSYVHFIVRGSLSQSYKKGFYELAKTRQKMIRDFLKMYDNGKYIDLIDEKDPDLVAYSLFKESLCGYKEALGNIQSICENASYIFCRPKQSRGRYAFLYKLGKRKKYRTIVLLSKLMYVAEPIYRHWALNR